jgi:hypothetical protein
MPDILARTVKTPVGDAPVVPVMLLSFGAYLAWFAVHYWRSDTAWPTDPLKAVLTGQPIPVPDRSTDEAALQGIVSGAQSSPGSSPSPAPSTSAGTAPTGTISRDQIRKLWTDNGGSPGTADIAAAIAEAESSGRTGVTSPNPDGGTNVGLWQLDTRGEGAGYTIQQLQDPATNARVTIMRSANGTKWGAWETYVKGTYKDYL